MNIVAYCRVSTNKDDQLNSLEVQKSFFEEYARKNGHNLVKIYADEGISGTKTKNRKEFQQMMRDADRKMFDMVVVKDISRLARNAVDFLQGIRYLKANGVACNFVNANLSSQDSEMILGTLALVAQEESANTSKRIKMSKKINAEKGRVPNLVFGYNKINGDYFNLAINPSEADVVKRMFYMYIHQGYGAAKIAAILNNEGLRTKRNCKWSQNAVARILANQLYTGRIVNGKEEIQDFLTGIRSLRHEQDWFITEKPELRIIDDSTFQMAAQVLAQRSQAFRVSHERQSNKHLLSTIIKCKHCGYSFRRRTRTYKNTYIDWACSGRNANGVDSCPNKTVIYEADLIAAIEAYFANLLKNKPHVISNIVTRFHRLHKAKAENIALEQNLRDKLHKFTRSKQKYMDMYEDDAISRQEMREKIGELNSLIQQTSDELKLVECNLDKGDMLGSILAATFKDIESVASLDGATNAQLKRVIDKIVVDEYGNIDIYLPLFNELSLDNTALLADIST